MKLADLFGPLLGVTSNKEVLGIISDSRRVEPGYVFAFFKPENHIFVNEAIRRGAVAIFAPESSSDAMHEVLQRSEIDCFFYKDPRSVYHLLASNFYRNQPKNIVAITGTNGKGSVAHMFQSMMVALGHKTANIGTSGVSLEPGKFVENPYHMTSPDAADMHKYLNQLYDQGFQYLVFEASSHGLVQQRLDSVKLSAAALTNISHDHLDYHRNKNAYIAAKKLLFSKLLPLGCKGVLNSDITDYQRFASLIPKEHLIDYGVMAKRIKLIAQNPTLLGQNINYLLDGIECTAKLKLLGKFQAHNLLCAIGLMMALGIDRTTLNAAGLDGYPTEAITAPPGRMELVRTAQEGPLVVVDHAHTPDSLLQALQSLRWHGFERILVVFGCGGQRDKDKRKLMGEIASKNADELIICDDNPREEDPDLIRADIIQGVQPGVKAIEIVNRQEAIGYAIDKVSDNPIGKIILVAGRGDESHQIIGQQLIPCSDKKMILQKLSL